MAESMFSRAQAALAAVVLLAASPLVILANGPAISFDVPAIVVGQPVNPAVVAAPTTGGQLMRLRIPVSTYIAPDFGGKVSEYSVEIDSPSQTLRVVDFWPKNETYSEYEGSVRVESSRQQDEHFNFHLAAAYPGVGQAGASGDYRNRLNVQESYHRRPPMQTLTSSGTIRQGYGVFYKFRPGPVDVLEGAREVAVLVEVPRGWRADLLHVAMTAVGTSTAQTQRSQILGQSRMWITTHREGDEAAAAQAIAYVRHERHLRGLAASQQREIDKRSRPTLWHRVGAVLEVSEGRIPANYLTGVIFGPANPQFDHGTQRLPVDLRVAILDYWDQRQQLLQLARGGTASRADPQVVAKIE